jgi:hypothetical protein
VIAKCDALLVETEADGTTSTYAAMNMEGCAGSRAASRATKTGGRHAQVDHRQAASSHARPAEKEKKRHLSNTEMKGRKEVTKQNWEYLWFAVVLDES